MSREDIAVALTTSFRSSLIAPFSTPELRAAFEQLKDFVRVNATAGEIESRAFRLVGESQEAPRGHGFRAGNEARAVCGFLWILAKKYHRRLKGLIFDNQKPGSVLIWAREYQAVLSVSSLASFANSTISLSVAFVRVPLRHTHKSFGSTTSIKSPSCSSVTFVSEQWHFSGISRSIWWPLGSWASANCQKT